MSLSSKRRKTAEKARLTVQGWVKQSQRGEDVRLPCASRLYAPGGFLDSQCTDSQAVDTFASSSPGTSPSSMFLPGSDTSPNSPSLRSLPDHISRTYAIHAIENDLPALSQLPVPSLQHTPTPMTTAASGAPCGCDAVGGLLKRVNELESAVQEARKREAHLLDRLCRLEIAVERLAVANMPVVPVSIGCGVQV